MYWKYIDCNIICSYNKEHVDYIDTTSYFRGFQIDYWREKSRRRKIKILGNCLTFLVEKENIEYIKLLLDNDNVDVNLPIRVITIDKFFPYDGRLGNHDIWHHVITQTPLIIVVKKITKKLLNCYY